MQTARLDIALLYDPRVFTNISLHDVGVEDLMLIADRKNPVLLRNSIGFSDLNTIPVVLPGKHHVLRNLIEHIAAREGITPKIAIESDSFSAIVELVKCGYMTIMPHFAMLQEINTGLFGAIPIVDPTPSWRFSVILSKKTINMCSGRAVTDILIDLITEMMKNGTWRGRAIIEAEQGAHAAA